MTTTSSATRKFTTLLNDFGFRLVGNRVESKTTSPFSGGRITRKCRNAMDAVEQLIPVIREDEFSERYRKIVNARD